MAINYEYLNKKSGVQANQGMNSRVQKYGNRFNGNMDPNTSEGLYNIAMQQGGRTAEVIGEMAHPEKSILSSAGNKLRKLGAGIINVLETPNEVIAGVINTMKDGGSLSENVKKAIKNDISASDSLLGDFNSNNKSGLQKVGNFVFRTGIDILLDPLTYLTFGTSRGVLGLSAAPKITAGKKLAAEVGKKTGKTVGLAEGAGDDLLAYVDELSKGAGDDIINPIKERLGKNGIGDDTLDGVVKEETDKLLKLMDTDIINFDVARKAMTNILEVNPGLAEQVLDKGGIKFFGKTILEGQKIRTAAQAIPGMKYIDTATEGTRMAIGSLFNPNIQGGLKNGFYRIPEEYRMFSKQLGKIKKERGQKFLNRLTVSLDEIGFKTLEEKNMAIRNAYSGAIPSDPKMLKAYKKIHELDGDNWLAMKAAGKNVSYLANRIPRLVSKQGAKESFDMVRHSTLSETINAAKQKKNVIFESVSSNKKIVGDDGTFKAMKASDAIAQGIDETQVKMAIAKDAQKLATKVDEIASLDLPNGRELMYEITAQKKAIEAGKLDNVFLDEETGEVFTRRAATLDETLQMPGFSMKDEDINFLETFAQSSMQTINQAASTQFVRDIARFGVVSDEAATHFRGLNIDKNITDEFGKDIFFDEEVATNLEKMVKMMTAPKMEPNAFLAAYDNVLSVWKSSVTSMFPSFHARNGLSNVLLNFADIGYHAFNPKTFATAGGLMTNNKKYVKLMDDIIKAQAVGGDDLTKLLAQKEALLTRPVFKDVRGHDWTFGELRDIVKSKDIAFTDIATAIPFDETIRKQKTLTDVLKKTEGKNKIKEKGRKFVPIFRDFYGYEKGRELGGAIENHGRLVNFLTNLEKTGDVSLAAARTKQFLFDYSDLTDFEKGVMRRIIPFYSFTRFNLEAQAKVLIGTPGKATAQLTAMETFTDVFSNDNLTDEQKEQLPSWMKRGFYYLKKQNDGTLKSISITENPLEQPLNAFTSKGILGSISPLVRLPIEQLTGYDMYQGKVFSEATNAGGYKYAPKFVKDYIGYDEIEWTDAETGKKNTWSVSLRPSRMNLMNNTPLTARVTSSMRQLTDSDNTTSQRAKQFLLGTSYTDVDIEKVVKYEEKQTLREYTNVLDTSGVLYQFKRNIISDN